MADVVPPGCERFDLELGELAAGVIDPGDIVTVLPAGAPERSA